MLGVIVLSMIILFVCMALLCIKIIVRKNGRFPNTHIGGNPALRKKGIKCAQTQDFEDGVQTGLYERLNAR